MQRYLLWIILTCLLASLQAHAQEGGTPYLYKGTVDGKLPVTMFLHAVPSECSGEMIYQGIYRYDKTAEPDNWLLLNIDHNGKNQFVMVETGFSGVLVLRKVGDTLTGIWLHPDGQKQMKVELKKKPVTEGQAEKYMNELDAANERDHDC
ncbi:hypothetical protein [Chitinophaga lutea]|uniref:hypothetical protein n=1 Tax=Chitinophaga lutea TaxID=2488634 RepID=UPI000F4FFAD8|nr:hypothetical protein [Chitinophaga lutea]